jgi:hypothetical protein
MSDLRIDRVETVLLDIPLRRPHCFARTSMTTQTRAVCLRPYTPFPRVQLLEFPT